MSRRLLLVLSAVVATASESGVAETGSPTALDVSEAGSPTGAVAETGSPTGAHAPGTVEAVYEEAADDADAAERVLVAAATAMPPNAEAKYQLGRFYINVEEKKDTDEAEILMKEAVALNADHAGAHFALGMINFHKPREDYQKAAEHFDKTIALDPTHVRARAKMAYLHTWGGGDKVIAENHLRAAIDVEPAENHLRAELMFLLGLLILDEDRIPREFAEAEALFNAASEIDPQHGLRDLLGGKLAGPRDEKEPPPVATYPRLAAALDALGVPEGPKFRAAAAGGLAAVAAAVAVLALDAARRLFGRKGAKKGKTA